MTRPIGPGSPWLAADAAGLRHVVAEGETLWLLAHHYYGAGSLYALLWEANRSAVSDPFDPPVGVEILIPRR